jgi:hypothetical protein
MFFLTFFLSSIRLSLLNFLGYARAVSDDAPPWILGFHNRDYEEFFRKEYNAM